MRYGVIPGVAMACVAAATVARAESIDRAAVTAGRLSADATIVARVRAEARRVVGSAETIDVTVIESLKGDAAGRLTVVLRGEHGDLREGDELLAYLARLPGERLGLVGGTYYVTHGPSRFSFVRLGVANRQGWLDVVRAHLAGGDATALVGTLMAATLVADEQLATDGVLDVLRVPGVDLAQVVTPEARQAFASRFLGLDGFTRWYRDAQTQGLDLLARTGAVEAWDGIHGLLDRELHPDYPAVVGRTLGALDAERTGLVLAARIRGTAEAVPTPNARVTALAAIRGAGLVSCLPVVLELFADGNDLVRRWAIVTAGELHDVGAIAPLTERLVAGAGTDPHCAAWALYRLDVLQGIPIVTQHAETHARADVKAWLREFLARPAFVGGDVLVWLAQGS